eukprot:15232646-Alexandrium_andersonii.AAC.1
MLRRGATFFSDSLTLRRSARGTREACDTKWRCPLPSDRSHCATLKFREAPNPQRQTCTHRLGTGFSRISLPPNE